MNFCHWYYSSIIYHENDFFVFIVCDRVVCLNHATFTNESANSNLSFNFNFCDGKVASNVNRAFHKPDIEERKPGEDDECAYKYDPKGIPILHDTANEKSSCANREKDSRSVINLYEHKQNDPNKANKKQHLPNAIRSSNLVAVNQSQALP